MTTHPATLRVSQIISAAAVPKVSRGPLAERLLKLDVNALRRHGVLEPDHVVVWRWELACGGESRILIDCPDDRRLRVVYRHTTEYAKDVDIDDLADPELRAYEIPLTWTGCNFGGRRPWFECPNSSCRRRVGKLYLRRYFLCRHCQGITYMSRLESDFDRSWRRKRKLIVRLGGDVDHPWLPPRPKGMHHSTYERLCDRYFEEEAFHDDLLGVRVARLEAASLGRRVRRRYGE